MAATSAKSDVDTGYFAPGQRRRFVTTQISLGDYSSTPLYNIKAVVQATGISSSTLRAWERRYQMVTPNRSDSGYRLYSDQDIAVIHWLKTQVESGMSISQAVSWLEQISEKAGDRDHAILPGSADDVMTPTNDGEPSAHPSTRL